MAPRVVVVAVLAMALAAEPMTARAADALKPLRTLTYEVAVSIGFERRSPRSGLSTGGGGPMLLRGRTPVRRQNAGPEDATGGKVDAKGSIVVDVIAATEDGGLLVDLTENAAPRTHRKVRVQIVRDGDVRIDPKDAEDLTDEELTLARWIARGFYGDHPREIGTAWTVDRSTGGVSSEEHYRVLDVDKQRVTLDYRAESKSAGSDTFASTQRGSLIYDTALIVPLRVSYEDATRREMFEAHDEMHASIILTLSSDSFANVKR